METFAAISTHPDSQLFSLSSLSDSWSEVYKQWQLHMLTRHFLRDYTDSPNLDTHMPGSSMGHAGSSGYSTASPAAPPLQSSLLFSGTSSRAPGPMETHLAPQASRGAGNGNGVSTHLVSVPEGSSKSNFVSPCVFN